MHALPVVEREPGAGAWAGLGWDGARQCCRRGGGRQQAIPTQRMPASHLLVSSLHPPGLFPMQTLSPMASSWRPRPRRQRWARGAWAAQAVIDGHRWAEQRPSPCTHLPGTPAHGMPSQTALARAPPHPVPRLHPAGRAAADPAERHLGGGPHAQRAGGHCPRMNSMSVVCCRLHAPCAVCAGAPPRDAGRPKHRRTRPPPAVAAPPPPRSFTPR